jgi:hypothetical protein
MAPLAGVVLCCASPLAQAKSPSAVATSTTVVHNGRELRLHLVPPQITDPRIVNNDANNVVLFDPKGAASARLFVFIGGAEALDRASPVLFWRTAVEQGYRMIALDFRYQPPATKTCNRSTNDACFEEDRALKVLGVGSVPGVNVAPAESIVNRLTQLLLYLDLHNGDEGWASYLADEKPRWARIAVSGFSQGSGLAAFVAKKFEVARVVLVSSPWDHFTNRPRLASWLTWQSATPRDRWYGLYSAHEPSADWLGRAYAALGVPNDHIRVLAKPPRKPAAEGTVPYHWSTIGREYTPINADGSYAYQSDWRFVLGRGDE